MGGSIPGKMPVTRRTLLTAAASAALARPALAAAPRSFAQRAGTVFTAPPADPSRPPVITEIALPEFPDSHAIWGSTGRDDAGRIWSGVSAVNPGFSAHLFSVDPATLQATLHGDVLSALRAAGLAKPGEGQIKIHSKIVPADDGNLYFTSTDEEDENDDPPFAPPRWGSHLWRMRPPDGAWEHLLAVPEGLTCAAGFGGQVYALGLWNHVLYSYEIATGTVRRTEVGAPGGHMSRNLLVDRSGHAFVPRVRLPAPGAPLQAELVEFDPALREIAATPLEHYADGQTPSSAHGITGFAHLADGGMAFVTGCGHLYRIAPDGKVAAQGWMHPLGTSYTASLFTWDGARHLAGIGTLDHRVYEWLVFDLATGTSTRAPFEIDPGIGLLLYGSCTRSDDGALWLAGRRKRPPRVYHPLLLRLET